MKKVKMITVRIDSGPDLRFKGELVTGVASFPYKESGIKFSGQVGRCEQLDLYKTNGGKFICNKLDLTLLEGERSISSGKACETLEEVKEFFGYGWLAKELYKEAKIDCYVEVE